MYMKIIAETNGEINTSSAVIGCLADSAFLLATVQCKLNLIFDYKNGYFYYRNMISYWQPKFMTKIGL